MVAFVVHSDRLPTPIGCAFTPLPSTINQLSFSDEDEDDDDEQKISHNPPNLSEMPKPLVPDPRDANTADSWIKRHPSLIRLTGKHPFNSEPPLPLLMHHGFITPVPIHYVRNHGPVPGQSADWCTWTVEICGLVTRPASFTVAELVQHFPSFEIPVTLVCAGNRRKEQNIVRKSIGFNWGPAAISTSLWRGIRLRDVLRRCGVMGSQDGALNVCFEGAEDLPGGGGSGGSKYGTSVKKEVAMDPSRDIMIAYMQNGELLTPDHGFPCRMIIPGFIGGRMVKWLKRIIVTTRESENYYHYKDNRVLPSHVDAELADAQGWWYKPEYIINELNINSVITSPGHQEILRINSQTKNVLYILKGYAYSGGGKKLTRVEVSLDGGETWRDCAVDHLEKPNKYGKYWCWCFWSVNVDTLHLLAADDIAVRAWDQTLNTQPQNLIWNVMGMMNNCWFRVRVTVRRPEAGDISLAFEHPTQPGNLPGGWMPCQKELNHSGNHNMNGSITPSVNTTTAPVKNAEFTLSDLRKHSCADSAWIVIHGHVYDCTAFLKHHPGGAESILINAGSDCSDDFDAIHSDKAKAMLATYRIGKFSSAAPTNKAGKIPVKLIAKTQINRDVRLFRFALPAADQLLRLKPGKHIFLSAVINNKNCMRAYTPTSPEDAVGYFELLIRIYTNGLMTQHLDSLPLGAAMEIKGPAGRIEYSGRGSFVIDGKPRRVRRVAMVAGGTGITPLYQVIRAAMWEDDGVEVHLVYASRSEDDILLREDLDRWVRERPERLKVWYVVGEVRREDWAYGVGRLTEGMLSEHVPMGGEEERLALVCGPPAMLQAVVLPTLEKMKYDVGKSCYLF